MAAAAGIYRFRSARVNAMTFESWAAFTAASAILLIIPGPTILLVVSYALGQGWRTALPMAVGVALGDFTAMTLSMLGIGALLAASATVFTILKWIGAAYLIYLGVKLFRAGGALDAQPRTDAVSAAKMMGHAWLVTALNPKSITFFVAFLPQFLEQERGFSHPDADLRDDVPDTGLRQCLWLRAGRDAGAQRRAQPASDRHLQQDRRDAAGRRRHRHGRGAFRRVSGIVIFTSREKNTPACRFDGCAGPGFDM